MRKLKRTENQYQKLKARLESNSNIQHKKTSRFKTLARYEKTLLAAGLITTIGICPQDYLMGQDPIAGQTGPDQVVNAIPTGNQVTPDIAMDADGDFVVVWDDNATDQIKFQLFDATGMKVGGEIIVASQSGSSILRNPAVAMNDEGEFVIVWEEFTSPFYQIGKRDYLANGSAVSVSSFINITTFSGNNLQPDVAFDDDEYHIAWYNDENEHTLFVESNNCMTQTTLLTGTTSFSPRDPAISMDENGDFVVAFSLESTGAGNNILAFRYDNSCPPNLQQSYFMAVSTSSVLNVSPDIAMDEDGDFVAVWVEDDFRISFSDYSLKAFTYKASNGATSTFTVREGNGTRFMFDPAVAMLEDDGFVVVWSEFESTATLKERNAVDTRDSDGTGIVSQTFDGNNMPVGDLLLVNEIETDSQSNPKVASDDQNNFNVAWQSDNQDGDQESIVTKEESISQAPAAPIPTLSQWGIIVLGLLTSILGLVGLKYSSKKKRKAI